MIINSVLLLLLLLQHTLAQQTNVNDDIFALSQQQRTNIIVVDNFYDNPDKVRYFALNQEFNVHGNYPGPRTRSYANQQIKQKFEQIFGKKITTWRNRSIAYNGAFQYSTSRERSWIHTDGYNTHAAVIYLTPNAPLAAGTQTFMFKASRDRYKNDDIVDLTDDLSQDFTKFEVVDKIGNVYNRLILFNSKQFHMSVDYFGMNKYDGRLYQVFFFNLE